jgi:hypothetical protein
LLIANARRRDIGAYAGSVTPRSLVAPAVSRPWHSCLANELVDLTFYRHAADVRYAHIDQLFGAPGENTINWQLIQTHWVDLMQVVLSIRAGRLSSTPLLRRLGTESRKNNIYKAFRELGRVIRTITLLRYISEPELREEITAATNKVESYNEFSAWLRFGHDTIERNDPAEQEKIIKFNTLLANCVIFHTALDMTTVLRQLAAKGLEINPSRRGRALAVHQRADQTLRRVRHRRSHRPARRIRPAPRSAPPTAAQAA